MRVGSRLMGGEDRARRMKVGEGKACGRIAAGLMALAAGLAGSLAGTAVEARIMEAIGLPAPQTDGGPALAETLALRRSVRQYGTGALSLADISQLLWAAQGLTSPEGLRTAPSAGALYPLEMLLVVGHVTGLEPGVYRYLPHGHRLTLVREGDKRRVLARAALGQAWIRDNGAVVVFAANYERVAIKYGERGVRYAQMEVGHAAQNLFLQATALGLGTVVVGAFNDTAVKGLLGMARDEQPLCLMPVGRRR